MTNLPDNYAEIARQEMTIFNRLPKTLRATLRDTNRNFHSEYVWVKWKGGQKCAELVRRIKTLDQELSTHEN